MIQIECHFPPTHVHEYPDDWNLGGANATDPRADSRWRPSTYEYIDDRLDCIHTTQVPLCDDQALDEFTKVAGYGPDFNPVWLKVCRPDGTEEMLPWIYDKQTDEVRPR